MVSLHHLSLCNKRTPSLPQLHLITTNKPIPLISLWLTHGDVPLFKKTNTNQSSSSSSSSSSSCVVRALEKDSQQYEIDQEKAREALQKLDQQLQDLSKKQVTPPKVKVSDVKITRDQTIEEVPEMSGSFLAFFAAGLFLFTILYNLLYITVIDPSGDAPEPTPVTPTTDLENESPQVAAVLQPLPLAPDVSK
ncbi:uncharacterized protein LOC125369795 [Ricinus communis]|uniref:uncharacterized protein LOC125369795 n=1 Tax=Ricinus communis TaxID=3988 RepID=UPI00201B1065|nr:uncharacterized protein LOC125369795 [Ricinus communis]